MRTRSKVYSQTRYPTEDTWSYKYKNQSAQLITTTYDYAAQLDSATITDDPHPHFFTRIGRGDLVLGALSYKRTKQSIPDGHAISQSPPTANIEYWSRSGTTNWTWYRTNEGRGPVYTVPVSSDMDTDATLLLKAMSRVDPSEYDLIEDVLSIRQTVDSLRTSLTKIKTVARKIHDHPKNLADAWLTYRFEFIPLYNTCADLIRSSVKDWKTLKNGVRLRAKAQSSGRANVSGVFQSFDAKCKYSVSHSVYTQKRAFIYYKLKAPRSGINQTYGTRFKDLPRGLWNIVTLSFMVDRVVDISTWLQAAANLCDTNIVLEGGCITTESETRKSVVLFEENFDTKYIVSTPAIVTEELSITRALASLDIGMLSPDKLQFRPLGLVDSIAKATDLAALITSYMTRRSR